MAQVITPTQIAARRTVQNTAVQLGIDVLVAIAVAILANLDQIDSWEAVQLFLVSLVKTVISAAATFVVRRYVVPPEKDRATVVDEAGNVLSTPAPAQDRDVPPIG